VSRRRPVQPNAALAEMLARDAEAAGGEPFGGYAGEFASPPRVVAPPPAPPPVVIPRADWDAEERERRARVAERYFHEDTESYPAKRRSRED
jgi:hypothetical protein